MASRNPSNIIRAPSDVTFDGTPLGNVRAIYFKPQIRSFDVWAEEFGTVVERLYSGESGICGFVSRDFDAALIGKVFPAGSPKHDPSAYRAGSKLSDNAGVLRTIPKDSSHPSLRIDQAVPLVEMAATINFSVAQETGFACIFLALPDPGGGQAWEIT